MKVRRYLAFATLALITILVGLGCGGAYATPTPIPIVESGDIPPRVEKFDLGLIAPTHLESDGESIWVSSVGKLDTLNTEVLRFGLDGTEMGSFDIGRTPGTILFDGEDVWVAELGIPTEPGSRVVRLSGEGAELGVYEAGNSPFAMTFDGENLWVVNPTEDSVTKISKEGCDIGDVRGGGRALGAGI